MEKLNAPTRVASSELVRQRWPNNKPTLTSEETMAKRGMALECTGPNGQLGHREAWFIDIFGRHEMHMLPNEKS
jgi:uncharacterized Zn-finger protein